MPQTPPAIIALDSWESVLAGNSAIAIDGPVASGKTAVGRLLAHNLRYRFLDTGLMYRAVAWTALRRRVPMDDEEALTRLAQHLRTEVVEGPEGDLVSVDGVDATRDLRAPAVDEASSQVSRVLGVRKALVAQQQEKARSGSIVMVGRDIGTVVLPDAQVKLFLHASEAERAHRRHQEMEAQGQHTSYEVVRRDVEARDRRDQERVHSPLRPAPDAHVFNTEDVSVDEVVRRIQILVRG